MSVDGDSVKNEPHRKIITWLNEQLESDLKNLSKVRALYTESEKKKKCLEDELSCATDSGSKVSRVRREIDEICSEIQTCMDEIDAALNKVERRNEESEELYLKLKDYFSQIDELKKVHTYMKTLDFIRGLSKKLESLVTARDVNLDRAIDVYRQLCDICKELNKTSCSALRTYLVDTTRYWHHVLCNEMIPEFAAAVKNSQWHTIGSKVTVGSTPTPDALSKFQSGVRRLLLIQLPPDLEDKPVVSSSLLVSFPQPSLPIYFLLLNLKKMFLYHFSGSKRTNRIDKPEWYFTHVLTVIRNHEHFIVSWVAPIYADLGLTTSPLAEFMAALVQLTLEKLQTDLETAQYDDALFSHIVDESLAFERELRQTCEYPSGLPGPVQVLTQAQLFVKWINMERKYARDKMDQMMASDTAWTVLGGLPDDEKVTEVGHSFLTLLLTMADRFSLLPQPGHRLQFVELELELIDDMRVSLLQVLHTEHADPLNSKLPQVLNTVSHLRGAIEQYDASPAMILLDHYRTQYTAKEKDEDAKEGVFHNSLQLLEHLENQLLLELTDALMMEVKARSRPFRKDK